VPAVITVIGPNPAVDYTLEVPGFRPGETSRSKSSLRAAGGKPVNVARTIHRLGGRARLVAPLGGAFGEAELIAEECRRLEIDLHALPIADSTRTCVIVVDPQNGSFSVINEPGPDITTEEAQAYEEMCVESLTSEAFALVSGSLPPGLSASFYAHIVAAARQSGAQLIVDASGEPLELALAATPWAVKVNAEEILAVTGDRSVETATDDLVGGGIEHVVVTMGGKGAVYTGAEGRIEIAPAPVRVVNPIGSGDAFLGALAVGLSQGKGWPDALRLAGAAAGLAASRFGQDIGPDADLGVRRLL
jgi:tagatose 6-phosphate kinase